MRKLSYLFLFFLISCSSVQYKSKDVIDVFMGHHPEHKTQFLATGEVEFFLWGFYPGVQTVWIDHKFKDLGAVEVSLKRIEEYQTIKDSLYTIFSFGLYKSLHYKLYANGIKVNED